jgi:hypothetical protein
MGAVSGRAAGQTGRYEPERPSRVDVAGPLLRAAAAAPGHRPCAVRPDTPAPPRALPALWVPGAPRRPAPAAPGLSDLSDRVRDPRREIPSGPSRVSHWVRRPMVQNERGLNHPPAGIPNEKENEERINGYVQTSSASKGPPTRGHHHSNRTGHTKLSLQPGSTTFGSDDHPGGDHRPRISSLPCPRGKPWR